jgi:hypothetical protein
VKRIIIIVIGALSASPVSAQGWSTEQQGVIDQITRCNDAWVESIARKAFEVYAKSCPETQEARFWYPGSAAPSPYGGPEGVWSRSSAANRAVSWQDLKPMTVQIDGDVALAYYAVTWTVFPHTGESRRNPSHRMTVFRRVNRQWLMAGGTIAAATN